MSREDELAMIRQHMSIIAERVARLVEVISIKTQARHSTALAEEQVALLESMMWRLHRHGARLKAEMPMSSSTRRTPPAELSA